MLSAFIRRRHWLFDAFAFHISLLMPSPPIIDILRYYY
jgi:hypothetical protein